MRSYEFDVLVEACIWTAESRKGRVWTWEGAALGGLRLAEDVASLYQISDDDRAALRVQVWDSGTPRFQATDCIVEPGPKRSPKAISTACHS